MASIFSLEGPNLGYLNIMKPDCMGCNSVITPQTRPLPMLGAPFLYGLGDSTSDAFTGLGELALLAGGAFLLYRMFAKNTGHLNGARRRKRKAKRSRRKHRR